MPQKHQINQLFLKESSADAIVFVVFIVFLSAAVRMLLFKLFELLLIPQVCVSPQRFQIVQLLLKEFV